MQSYDIEEDECTCPYTNFTESTKLHESDVYYLNTLCLNSVGQEVKGDYKFLESLNLPNCRNGFKKCCVLPRGHQDKCSTTYDIFIKSSLTEKLISSVEKAIYYTPGNDDYVYKNRAQRLYPYAISAEDEKKIKDKDIKKKCAIPLKDASTPICMAQAYLDYMTFIYNIKGIDKYICYNENICKMLVDHKKTLIDYYKNRYIFDKDGYTICAVTRKTLSVLNFADPDRDNRINIDEDDIQMGHCVPRNDNMVTIRGKNLVPMTRKGNRIIGDNNYCEDKWIDDLKEIVSAYK